MTQRKELPSVAIGVSLVLTPGARSARRRIMKKQAFLSLFGLLLAAVPLSTQEGGFQIVVSASNSISSIPTAQLTRLFLKKTTTWSNGLKVVPVDQRRNSTVREAFSQRVHGKDASNIISYWQRQIFSGKASPPPEVSSDREVLEFIRRNSGAIGYVSSGTSLGGGVKAVRVAN
jgi:ABC-type phosphate transport system substrate-binding protein